MLHQTSGIVFRSIKYSENSLIVKIYTQLFGLQSYMINGVRKAGPKNKASLFQPLNILDLVVYNSEKRNLQRLKEYKREYVFTSLPFEIAKSSIGLFILEILNKVIKEEEANNQMYDFICRSIIELDTEDQSISSFHLQFLLKLTNYLGFMPEVKQSEEESIFDMMEGGFVNEAPTHPYYLSPSLSINMDQLIRGLVPRFDGKAERQELLDRILQYYELHIPNFSGIKSHKVLKEILS